MAAIMQSSGGRTGHLQWWDSSTLYVEWFNNTWMKIMVNWRGILQISKQPLKSEQSRVITHKPTKEIKIKIKIQPRRRKENREQEQITDWTNRKPIARW
jgi:hypothetical protein